MADDFRAHGRGHGGRLEEIQGLGRRGGLRFVDVGKPAERGAQAYLPPRDLPMPKHGFQELPPAAGQHSAYPAQATAALRKAGRPRATGVRPWEAAGLSRTEYFRRRKAGK